MGRTASASSSSETCPGKKGDECLTGSSLPPFFRSKAANVNIWSHGEEGRREHEDRGWGVLVAKNRQDKAIVGVNKFLIEQ